MIEPTGNAMKRNPRARSIAGLVNVPKQHRLQCNCSRPERRARGLDGAATVRKRRRVRGGHGAGRRRAAAETGQSDQLRCGAGSASQALTSRCGKSRINSQNRSCRLLSPRPRRSKIHCRSFSSGKRRRSQRSESQLPTARMRAMIRSRSVCQLNWPSCCPRRTAAIFAEAGHRGVAAAFFLSPHAASRWQMRKG